MSEKIISIGGAQFNCNVERDGDSFRAGSHEVTIIATHDNMAELQIDGRTVIVPFFVAETKVSFVLDGETWAADVAAKGSPTRARHHDHSMSAPMPGAVLKILVAAGQQVSRGAPLLILEAMKMEHVIVAPYDGVVQAIHCREGELVQPGVDLISVTAGS